MDKWINLFFVQLDHLTIVFGLVTYAFHFFWGKKSSGRVQVALCKAVSSSGIPNGIAFLICSFEPTLVAKMQGCYWAFLIGGLALISITAMDIAKPRGSVST